MENQNFLNNINIQILNNILVGEKKTIEFLFKIGLLKNNYNCRVCLSSCKIKNLKNENICFSWKCTNKTCQKEFSIKNNSFFENTKSKFSTILRIIYYWCQDLTQEYVAFECNICKLYIYLLMPIIIIISKLLASQPGEEAIRLRHSTFFN